MQAFCCQSFAVLPSCFVSLQDIVKAFYEICIYGVKDMSSQS